MTGPLGVHNAHQRALPVPAARVGALLDRMGRPGDPLWPAPDWSPMVLQGPLAVGVKGHHGPIRYHVSRYLPGREIEFTFAAGVGVRGTHTLTVEPTGPQACVLRHDVTGRLHGPMLAVWPLAMCWLHNACVEDLLDRAETVLGTGPARPRRWSRWVRLLRRAGSIRSAVPVTVPVSSESGATR
ncbi:SRPBCC family protein [Pseudonocardia sp. GCM10023141]|uniref:SRPBCC family protein n=1 Tax=Pseudonocardia sp. GCM10023141 TaxID=3252653 RepID=UPI00360A4F06